MSLHHHVVSIAFRFPDYRIHNAPHIERFNPMVDKSIWSDIVEIKNALNGNKSWPFPTNKILKKVKGQRCDYRHEDGIFFKYHR